MTKNSFKAEVTFNYLPRDLQPKYCLLSQTT